ncbi:hypothetical protein [Yoonia vestfoldensis]|uniref:hypothetical protein n=1 Tax=Yoonia vestfoldensis TaxID=245188 RepID=UPI000B377538|nr:hypothetical protein [Yoonia vestfoldensis]
MKSSCPSIEKPQSSNKSAKSQNALVYQIKTNTSHERHCRASGFVREPTPEVSKIRCVRTQHENLLRRREIVAAPQR